ncbi:MAG: GtrA family protein [Elusimicrobiota bacterium]
MENLFGAQAANVIQFLKYAVAGGVATVTHIFFFHLCAWKVLPALQDKDWAVRFFQLPPAALTDSVRARNSMIDNFLAFMVANMVAYLINAYWVFEAGRHHFLVELALFYAVSGIAMVIGTGMMGFLIKRFGMLTTYAFCANIVSALLINYAARKFFIFKG